MESANDCMSNYGLQWNNAEHVLLIQRWLSVLETYLGVLDLWAANNI